MKANKDKCEIVKLTTPDKKQKQKKEKREYYIPILLQFARKFFLIKFFLLPRIAKIGISLPPLRDF